MRWPLDARLLTAMATTHAFSDISVSPAYVAKRPVADLCMVFTRGVQNRSAVDLASVWI